MAHFTPFTPLYVTPDGSITADPSKRQLGREAIGTSIPSPISGRTYLCEGPVMAGDMAYLAADDRVTAKASDNAARVYVESISMSRSRHGKTSYTATVALPTALNFTATPQAREVDIHTIACDDAPKEVDPRRWRVVVNTVFADYSETTPTSRMLARRGRFDPARDIAHDLLQISPVVAAYAVARFVWGYDIASATADALARCKREDDPALTRYLVAYERA